MTISLSSAQQILPSLTVDNLLWAAGIPWPAINECDVQKFAQLVRDFSTAVSTTHDNATQAIQTIAQNYQGSATQAMTSGWSNLTNTQVSALTTACSVVAEALDIGAAWIIAQKVSCLAALGWMAGEIVFDQLIAVETLFLSEIAAVGTYVLARKVVAAFIAAVEQYVIGQLIGAAIEPFIAKLAQFTAGLDWSKSGATAGPAAQVQLTPAAVTAQTSVLQGLATSLNSQVAGLTSQLQALQFS
jgi:uncharacterized protein YukE